MSPPETPSEFGDAIRAVRESAMAWGDVRVEMATLNGNIETLTETFRIQLAGVVEDQADQKAELAEAKRRIADVEKWQWRAAGALALIAFVAGVGVTNVLG